MTNRVQPYGDLATARLLVIGHDPRLQRSQAQAERAFFFEYLDRPKPIQKSEARKYELAEAVCKYINDLTSANIPREKLYVTNLCNEFLPHMPDSGTVFIPEAEARKGVAAIADAAARGQFRIILPMSQQVFYWLHRLNFVEGETVVLDRFMAASHPNAAKARAGIYKPLKPRAFLEVCGRIFFHRSIPIIPVLHVKQQELKRAMVQYSEPMQMAKRNIMEICGKSLNGLSGPHCY